MPTLRFTAKNIATLREEGARTDYFDAAANTAGFGLRVSAAGKRTWFLIYRASGRQKRLSLGTFPPMGLEKARSTARTALLNVQVNEADPAAAKKARRSADTFERLAERYLDEYAKPTKRSWREDARQLRSMVLPKWKNRKQDDITAVDVRDLLGDVARNRGGVTANRLRALLSKLFRWAVGENYLSANPAAGLSKRIAETSRERELSGEELEAFWARLADAEAGGDLLPPVALWLRLRLLTAQRGGSVAKMRWSDLDFDQKVWEIPATDMKAGKSHVVPMSAPVVKLLEARRKTLPEDATYVLEGGRGRRQRLGVTEVVGLEDFKPHDLRRTAATGMARAGIARFIVARVLGHTDQSVTGIYDRYEYLNEKRVALDTWARTLTAILEGKAAPKALPFKRGA